VFAIAQLTSTILGLTMLHGGFAKLTTFFASASREHGVPQAPGRLTSLYA
jgi:hypothetical protein